MQAKKKFVSDDSYDGVGLEFMRQDWCHHIGLPTNSGIKVGVEKKVWTGLYPNNQC